MAAAPYLARSYWTWQTTSFADLRGRPPFFDGRPLSDGRPPFRGRTEGDAFGSGRRSRSCAGLLGLLHGVAPIQQPCARQTSDRVRFLRGPSSDLAPQGEIVRPASAKKSRRCNFLRQTPRCQALWHRNERQETGVPTATWSCSINLRARSWLNTISRKLMTLSNARLRLWHVRKSITCARRAVGCSTAYSSFNALRLLSAVEQTAAENARPHARGGNRSQTCRLLF